MFKPLAQAAVSEPLQQMLLEGGAAAADVRNDTFLAAVAFRYLFATPTATARQREAEYAGAVLDACARSADGSHGWSDPFVGSRSWGARRVEIVVHLRTWAEDSPCSLAKAKERFTSGNPFECGRCIPTAALACAERRVREYVARRAKGGGAPCALVLSDVVSAGKQFAARLAAIPGLAAVSEYSVQLPVASADAPPGRRLQGGAGGAGALRTAA
eukprot:4680262-Prymnesium_polylepis.1